MKQVRRQSRGGAALGAGDPEQEQLIVDRRGHVSALTSSRVVRPLFHSLSG
jgi:hypothetical protein